MRVLIRRFGRIELWTGEQPWDAATFLSFDRDCDGRLAILHLSTPTNELIVDGCGRHGKRPPGAATTLYYGMNSAHALSQILFAAPALLALSQGLIILGHWPGLTLGFLAASGWLAICVLFLEYRQPRMTVALLAALLAAAALTS